MGLKFLDSGGFGDIADAITALQYAVDNGALISNNSWGGGGFSQAMYSAIQAAQGSASTPGHIFVAAAGNGSSSMNCRYDSIDEIGQSVP